MTTSSSSRALWESLPNCATVADAWMVSAPGVLPKQFMRVMRAGSVLAEPEPVAFVTTLEPLVTQPVASLPTTGADPADPNHQLDDQAQQVSTLTVAPPAPAAPLSVAPMTEIQPYVTDLVNVALSQGITVDELI